MRTVTARGRDSEVAVVALYPSLLGTYGDTGNANVLVRRLQWRGIPARLLTVAPGEPVPETGDVYVLGGGEDRAQVTAAALLADAPIGTAVDRGAVVFAVCAGFQLLGTEFVTGDGRATPGAGLLDVRTDRLPGAGAVGEVVTRCLVPGCRDRLLTGFENHRGRTTLGPGVHPLGRIVTGVGNGERGADGAVSGHVVGTYLHGPALARNAGLADLLLSWVTGPLAGVDDSAVERLRAARLHEAG